MEQYGRQVGQRKEEGRVLRSGWYIQRWVGVMGGAEG